MSFKGRAGRAGVLALAIILGGGLAAWGCAKKPPAPPAAKTPEQRGEQLFVSLGCNACHTTDGTPGACPTLKGLYGSEVRLVGGGTVKADDAYIREAIVDPDAKIVEGYSKGVMSAAVTRAQVEKPETLDPLVAYIKSLK